jgi:hypothetical protein
LVEAEKAQIDKQQLAKQQTTCHDEMMSNEKEMAKEEQYKLDKREGGVRSLVYTHRGAACISSSKDDL